MASLPRTSLTTVCRAATDEALLERFALASDREAITELAWRHESAMLGLAWSLLRERTAAEDAVQDTWVRVIRHAKTFRGQSAFRTWLLRILIHRCRDAVRASISARERTRSYSEMRTETAPLDRPDLDEDARRVAKAVAKLSPVRAELVILCHHHGLTHQQAAEVLQIPIGTVKTRLYAAIDELRAILGEGGGGNAVMPNDSIDDRLRESLAALSKPVETGEEPSLVNRALAEVESGSQRTRAHGPADATPRPWHRRIPGGLALAMLALPVLMIVVGVFTPHPFARKVAIGERQENDAMDVQILEQPVQTLGLDGRVLQPSERAYAFNALPVTPPAPLAPMSKAAEGGALADAAKDSARADDQPRIIIRTGNCEIRVEDVEAGRARIESLLRADLGEYIEDASVQLDQDRPVATVVVRIGAGRFDEFAKFLEGIGTLRSLTVNSNDATDQLVDLEARIRNERKVEEEVLGLLANRPDAPLEDIVRVRRELSDVRGSIERMDAQRQSLIGRAELSTLRITLIGPEPTFSPVDQDAPSFGKRMRTAITDGWRTCTDSVMWIAEVIVSGLVWWIAAAVIIWLIVRHNRWTRTWR